ncbi:MAG TPA: adenylate/guanylate cyclase domain-containing protein [Stellaceae bacterium]|nr:adenylate/guanylate cyclase domain-containing protein [Stellaceae bacterium]
MSDNDGAAAGDLERRLATILSADVAAYSRLMAEDEEETLRVFRGHKEVFEKLVALHRGRIFNTAGDAILAEFGSAVEAVRCATEIQAALRTRNDQLPEDRQVQFRIGVNLGDVMVQDHDLLGDGVNVAARLQGAAAPGGICIAGSVYDQIRNRLSLSFKPLGDMKYKNIPQAVRTFSIVEAEGLGELPVPADRPERGAGAFPRWLAAATAVLLLAAAGGGGWWLYSDHQRQTPAAPTAPSAAERSAAAPTLAAPEKPAAATPPASAPVEPQRTDAAPAATPLAANDGVYAGPICFAAAQNLAATCFPVRVRLQDGSLSGQWPGRDPAVTMHLAGDVSASGHATIHLRTEKADGAQLAVVDFSGTLRNGSLDATGAFANGRTATLNWRKSDETQPSAAASPAPTPAPAIEAKPPGTAPAEAMPAVATTAAPTAVGKPPQPANSASLTTTASEGLYAGPICFGPGPAAGPRCFRAQATVQQGRITGQWPGRDPGVTMHLEGNVLPSGVVSIHMHADEASGKRRATINLTGRLRDGKLDATGAFLNGRSASLNWRKN